MGQVCHHAADYGALDALPAFERNVSGEDPGAYISTFVAKDAAPMLPPWNGSIGDFPIRVVERSAEVL